MGSGGVRLWEVMLDIWSEKVALWERRMGYGAKMMSVKSLSLKRIFKIYNCTECQD